jgi:hypothetical protein
MGEKLQFIGRWLTINAGILMLLLAFVAIITASFIISIVVGLYTLGGLLLVLAIIILLPERG